MNDFRDQDFSGATLYGDDFTPEQIASWYEDEREAYAELIESRSGEYIYQYHELNRRHGFRFVPDGRVKNALGFGSAFGHEFEPILDRIDTMTLLDASERMIDPDFFAGKVSRVVAQETGELALPSNSFDLVTVFGVLHHIPNVSFVLGELFRVSAPGGIVLVREPTTSMGGEAGKGTKRPGLTPHERGIPFQWMKRVAVELGFEIIRAAPVVFPLVPRLSGRLGIYAYNNRGLVFLDAILARLASVNQVYHATKRYQKIRAGAAFYVLRKPENQL